MLLMLQYAELQDCPVNVAGVCFRPDWAMHRFRRMRTLQKFVSAQASIFNHFNQERNLTKRDHFKLNRTAALSEWRQLCS